MSEALFDRARRVMPGGVSSPARAFGAVGGTPPFIASGSGCRLTDTDGNTYIDMLGSWGPLILGHSHHSVIEAIREAAAKGTSFGAPTEAETELAELICNALPSLDMVRFVSSGTEATMSALRLARAATGRSKVLKFAGCYHGHVDSLLVAAGSGVATLGLPDSPGITEGTHSDTIVAPYNDPQAIAKAAERFGEDLAAVILEPIAANMGLVQPAEGFLESVTRLRDQTGALLIFDEVVTGFRVGWSGAQGMLGVTPDLTTLGKVIGGGLPVGAYGGRRDLMAQVAPEGSVYQAGTLAGNPISVAAGLATLRVLKDTDPYEELEKAGARLEEGVQAAASAAGVPVAISRVGSMLTTFFADRAPGNLEDTHGSDIERFKMFFHQMLRAGVYWPPSPFETAYLSTAHTIDDIDQVVGAVETALEEVSDD